MDDRKVVPLVRRDLQRSDAAYRLHEKMRTMLLKESLHEKESKALFDETEFARRYGVTWAREDREALLDFQLAMRLSDREIRWLNRSNSLKPRDGRIAVHGPSWIRWGGYYQIVVLWLFIGTAFLAGAHRYDYSGRAVAIAALGCLALWSLSHYIWTHTVFPFMVRKRVDATQRPFVPPEALISGNQPLAGVANVHESASSQPGDRSTRG